MDKVRTRVAAIAAALAMALALGACGGDDEEGGSAPPKGTTGAVKQGGTITTSLTSQPDFLDPALSYTVEGWETLWLVYTPLLTYPHEPGPAGAKLIPGLAEALPRISPDGRTYSLKLRPNLRYSDGSPVKASDFEHTIKRVLNLESGGASFYEGIVGAGEYIESKKADADIRGIEANDETGEISVKLSEPDGSFSHVLAMSFAGLVPGDTKFENLTKEPPPGVGPYKITKSEPNRGHTLEKNRGFNVPGIPKGNLDVINVRINKSTQRQAQDVISGRTDYMNDPPAPDLLPEIRQKHRDRYREHVTNSTYYFFMNVRERPFDKPEVRQAVNFGIDKPALARLFGGLLQPACNFLPPGMQGYRKIDPCPWGDPNRPPDLKRAQDLVRRAGEEGTEVTVYGNNEPETQRVTEAYADMLEKIGLRTKVRILDGAVYFQTIGNAKTKAQTGFANWFQDFPHPANFMFLVDGRTIQPTNNQNFGNVDDREITAGIQRLKREDDLAAVAGQWADLDRKLVERAYVAPYGHRKLTTFLSKRMNFKDCAVFHPLYQNDMSSFCLK